MINVRPATPYDAAEILEIHRQAVEQGTFVQTSEEFKETVESKREFILSFAISENSELFVAEHEGKVLGWLFLRGYSLRKLSHVAMLGMAVGKEFRGQGVGFQLVSHAIQWAKKNSQLKRISLAVFASNHAGIHIYKKAGFEVEGVERNEVRLENGEIIDQLIMGLTWK